MAKIANESSINKAKGNNSSSIESSSSYKEFKTPKMPPAFLIFCTVSLFIIFIKINTKFSKSGSVSRNVKQVKTAEDTTSSQQKIVPHHIYLVEILKMIYGRYVEGIPNYESAQRLMVRLGNTFRVRLPFGSTDYQVTADPVFAKRIMADPSWPERVPLDNYIQDAGFHKPYGLLFGGGKYYKPASRITKKLLQQLGFYDPVTMEGRFLFEIEELERKFEMELSLNGGEHTFCPRDIFGYLSINVVFHILLGKRNPFDQAVVTRLLNSLMTTNKKMSPVTTFLEIIPFLRLFPKLTFMGDLQGMSDMVYDLLREVIASKRLLGNYRDHVEDFVDGLLQHVDKSDNLEDGLNEENMLVVLRDMLLGGADTTNATLEHGLLFIALYPEVQEKVQAEIDSVVGQDRAPTYEDRRRMPYIEATLHEIYRMGCPIPATARAKHARNECSHAIISLYGIHRNESFYDEPNAFLPERFLDNEDPVKVVNTENLMPFGYGRRSCPGETAARVAVFIYFVVMMQKYSIKLSTRHPAPSLKNTHGFTRSPERYHITVRRRC